MNFNRRMKRLYRQANRLDLDEHPRLFIFSDCHRGAGDKADDFRHNQALFLKVLHYYRERGYSFIELGDGDELWENVAFEKILETYDEIFRFYSDLSRSGRFHFVWGNHNRDWKYRKEIPRLIEEKIDPDHRIEGIEGLVLHKRDMELFLLHGHQGELINDSLWWIGRFFVKIFWRPIQLKFGLPDVTSAAKNHRVRIRADRRFIKWTRKNRIPVIIGHTHRPIFPKPGQHPYFNSGSCIHPKGISGIEIDGDCMTLVKWNPGDRDRSGTIQRGILGGPGSLSGFCR